jgi:hypothetical protein
MLIPLGVRIVGKKNRRLFLYPIPIIAIIELSPYIIALRVGSY